MRHRDAALHGGHGGQRVHARTVAGRVDIVHARAGHAVHRNVAARGVLHARRVQAQIFGVGNRTDGHEAVRTRDLAAVREGHDDTRAVLGALHCGGAGAGHDAHAATLEDVFQHAGGVLVLAGEHAVAGGYQGHLRAQTVIGRGELGAGHARTDHDELLGHLAEVVQLGPGQDALAVGHARGHLARMRAHRKQHEVGV